MRELLFKNLTSGDKKRRDLFISESVDINGVKTVTQRHSTYIIKDHNKFSNMKDLAKWKNENPVNQSKRHIYILKKRDTKLQKDTFICDVVGNFYAVLESEVYSIAFKHSFEVDFSPTK